VIARATAARVMAPISVPTVSWEIGAIPLEKEAPPRSRASSISRRDDVREARERPVLLVLGSCPKVRLGRPHNVGPLPG
jgi:hypothetical protein